MIFSNTLILHSSQFKQPAVMYINSHILFLQAYVNLREAGKMEAARDQPNKTYFDEKRLISPETNWKLTIDNITAGTGIYLGLDFICE